MDGERGVLMGVDAIVGDTAGVYNMVGGETVHFWGLGVSRVIGTCFAGVLLGQVMCLAIL